MLRILPLFLVALFLFSSPAQAITTANFSIELIPENPEPGELVQGSVESYSINLDESYITWTYGGTVVARGIGEKFVMVRAGAASSSTMLQASVLVDGTTHTQSVAVSPAQVDILWEAVDAYTPPFYKGKPLGSVEGIFRATAFPRNGTSAKKFSYSWSRNGSAISKDSGYGKAGYLFKSVYTNAKEDVSVSVRSGGGTIGNARVNIPFSQPAILFYRNIDGFTHYHQALEGTVVMERDIETFRAEPFYISTPRALEKDIESAWSLGGNEAQQGDRENEFIISRGSSSGTTTVGFKASSPGKLFQTAEALFQLTW